MTKAELLASMVELDACGEARNYVSQHASDDALSIGLECENVNWLTWYLGRRDPNGIAAFARRCADRSGSRAASQYAAAAANYAIAAADYAIAAAKYASDTFVAAAERAAERAEQLRDLHEMWAELVGGEK